MKSMESRLKQTQGESHELRLMVNKLLEERQAMLVKVERYRVTEWDLCRQLDAEHKMRLDEKEKSKRAHEKAESIA